ncbi:MAG: EF-hand domain-containing protein [Planctomycetota bacterium]|nr:EF-hand domain-containing protein [Planctomycetota bacterium]
MNWALAICTVMFGTMEMGWAEEEQSSSAESKRAWLLEKFDANGDGQLDREERNTARKARILKKFDADGDGKLDNTEKDRARAAREKFQQQHGGNQVKRKEMLERFDADGDGKLSNEERKKAHKTRILKKYDSDGDGTLNPVERNKAKEAKEAKKDRRLRNKNSQEPRDLNRKTKPQGQRGPKPKFNGQGNGRAPSTGPNRRPGGSGSPSGGSQRP